MKKIIAFAAASLLIVSGPAFAQSASNSGSNSASGASATSINNFQGGKSYRGTGAGFAPGLAASGLSCQGSTSVGAGGPGWSFGFGSTKLDRDCNTRENAKVAGLIAGNHVAKEVICNIPEVEEAMEASGIPCLVKRSKRGVSSARYNGGGTVQRAAVRTFKSMKECRRYVRETGAALVCRRR